MNIYGFIDPRDILYISPFVSMRFLPEIKEAFGLTDEPRVQYDFSSHYECFLNQTRFFKQRTRPGSFAVS